jgi:hypothetical protein
MFLCYLGACASDTLVLATACWFINFTDAYSLLLQYLIPWGKIGKADVRASNRELEDEVIAYIREQIKGF